VTCIAGYQDLAIAGAELVVTVGIIEAAVNGNDNVPDEVKENLSDKVDKLCDDVHDTILEFQQFAEHYDRD
jgi:hypothetical protein